MASTMISPSDRIVTSSALRARDTAARVTRAGGFEVEIFETSDLYSSGPAAVLRVVSEEPDERLRIQAIHVLGMMDGGDALWTVFESDPSPVVKEAVLEAMVISGDADRLVAVAESDEPVELRAAAIGALGFAAATEGG